MSATIPKYCRTVAKNNYHNGHPDILPAGIYPGNAVRDRGTQGIEIKASSSERPSESEGNPTGPIHILDCRGRAALKKRRAMCWSIWNRPHNDPAEHYKAGRSKDNGELDLQMQGATVGPRVIVRSSGESREANRKARSVCVGFCSASTIHPRWNCHRRFGARDPFIEG
jgi:hypothetical protein